MEAKKVTIIGSGLIGRSWALIFSRAGYSVCLYDVIEEQIRNAFVDLEAKLKMLEQNGLLNGQTAAEVFPRISSATDLKEALKGAVHAQECVPEVLEHKIKIFAELDAAADPSTVLASSTSNIPSSKFTENLNNRQRCLVAHPINPPYAIPLVEICPAPWTTPELVQQTRALMEQAGQAPIVLYKEVNGFVLNRMQYALMAEAFRMVEDGVASPEDIDTAVTHGLGLRWSFMGPFQTIDLNAPQGVKDYCERYLGGMYNVLKEEDNSRVVSKETIAKIDSTMRNKYDVKEIPEWSKWRDQRLLALAVHKLDCSKNVDNGKK